MYRPVVARAAVFCLLVLATSSVAWAGPGSDPAAGGAGNALSTRRALERAPVESDAVFAASRRALRDHLMRLGVPAEAVEAEMVLIENAAQRQLVDSGAIAMLAAQADDAGASEKASDMLTAWAELLAYGAPQTRNFDPEGVPGMAAMFPPAENPELYPDVPIDGGSSATPKQGGICLSCPTVNFGTPVPLSPPLWPLFATHSDAIVPSTADCNWYAFSVVLGRRYTFKTCGPEGAGGWNTRLFLYDPIRSCATQIIGNDNCAGSPNGESTLAWDADFTGVAHLKVFGATAAAGGAYTLAYWDDGPTPCESCPSPGTAMPAMTGACYCNPPSATTSSCPSKYYTVPLVAGECYTFTTCPAECSGAASSFDTILNVYDPTCARIATSNDWCSTSGATQASTVSFTARVTGPHRIEVTGTVTSTGIIRFGSFTMCGRRDGPAGGYCPSGPFKGGGVLTPVLACAYDASTVKPCDDSWYQFNLTAGNVYEFTTCPGGSPCGLADAQFDSVIEIRDGVTCALIASNDDGCGTRSLLTYPAGSTGIHKVVVRGKNHAEIAPTGTPAAPVYKTYNLSYRLVSTGGCTPPTAIGFSPMSGAVDPGTCSRTETFAVTVDPAATTPITYSWNITPNAQASPFMGSVVSSGAGGAPASFSSTLTGAGPYTVSVTASNSCGSWPRSVSYSLLDLQNPVVTAGPDLAVACHLVPTAVNPPMTDNCDSSLAVTFSESATPGPCTDTYGLQRTWTATDDSGNSGADSQLIAVSDTQAPTLVGVPADTTVPCDDVPAPATVTATDLCDPSVSVSFSESTTPGLCPNEYVLTRTWSSTDRCNNTATATQIVNVVDDVAPVVTPSTQQIACLWPPNHRYACFETSSIVAEATDNCPGPLTWRIISVTTSDAMLDRCGDGNINPNALVAPDGSSFCVQAERCGQETTGGRVYTVEAVAIDACGNQSAVTPIGTVFVPHDQRGGLACQRANTSLQGNGH